MAVEPENIVVHNNETAGRFELALGVDMAVIEYRKRNNTYIMFHTEVPAKYTGQGIAGRLVHDALEMVRQEGATVLPYCPYVQTYLKRHPEYQDLVVPPPEVREQV